MHFYTILQFYFSTGYIIHLTSRSVNVLLLHWTYLSRKTSYKTLFKEQVTLWVYIWTYITNYLFWSSNGISLYIIWIMWDFGVQYSTIFPSGTFNNRRGPQADDCLLNHKQLNWNCWHVIKRTLGAPWPAVPCCFDEIKQEITVNYRKYIHTGSQGRWK